MSLQQKTHTSLSGTPAMAQDNRGRDASQDAAVLWKPYGALIVQMPDAAQIQRRAGLDVRISLASLTSFRLAAAHVHLCHVI